MESKRLWNHPLLVLLLHQCTPPPLLGEFPPTTDFIHVFRLVNDTIKLTRVQIFHLFDLSPKLPVVSVARLEKKDSVATIVMNKPIRCEKCIEPYRTNSLPFVLNNFQNIMHLVSAFDTQWDETESAPNWPASDSNLDSIESPSKYCVQYKSEGGPALKKCGQSGRAEGLTYDQFIDLDSEPFEEEP